MKPITILIVEDETLIRQGLRALLEKEDFVEAVHEASDSADFKLQISRREFDIILMDMKLPGTKGPDLIANMNVNNGQQKVIVVTGLEGVEIVVNLLKLGVRAIVSKLEGYTEIIKAIKEVMSSGHYFQERIYTTSRPIMGDGIICRLYR
jgi:DNA-binding NarL/FixJ family response regulator